MNEIKKINVDGVDYDIVSESAEKKIAELEKKVEGGDSSWTYHEESNQLTREEPQIILGTGCRIGYNPSYCSPEEAKGTIIGTSVWIAPGVFIGTNCEARGTTPWYDGSTVSIDNSVYIGSKVTIEGKLNIGIGVTIGGDVTLGEHVNIGADIQIEYNESGMVFKDTYFNRTAHLPWDE